MSNAIMLVNVVEEEEARIAIVEDKKLEEFYLERASGENIVGNIHKGTVVNVNPSIEAAFIEFGYKKHGFLHVSDVKPSAAKGGKDSNVRARHGDIKKLLHSGDEVLVQVTKEGIGDKGPALTTYLSLPGRYLVLMPGASLRGVSRRIGEDAERRRLREMIKQLSVPDGVGVIARTAGLGTTKKDLERDLDYLVGLWNTIKARADEVKGPGILYQESNQVIRVIRDVFHEDIRQVIVDSREMYDTVKDFLREVMPHHVRKVKLYDGKEPLFHHYKMEDELESMHSRMVQLPSGGSIVLDQTEALVAIDVNSGQFKGRGADAEKSVFKIDMEAAEEIARQVRLRDLGGVIIIDFIDMEDVKHRAKVEKALRDAMARDKARFRVLRMSAFCIVQMTRQRRRASLQQATYVECPACRGTGHVKSPETVALEMIRRLRLGLAHKEVVRVDLDLTPEVADYLNNVMRSRLRELESESSKQILIRANPQRGPEDHEIAFLKADGSKVVV